MNCRSSAKRWLAGMMFLAFAASCGSLNAADVPDKTTPDMEGWTLKFSDDFNRDSLHAGAATPEAPEWRTISGKWRVENGMLYGESAADIVLVRHFPGDQTLEFDAKAQPDNICDLTGILGASEHGGYADGYFFGFGSENNTYLGSKMLKQDRQIKRYNAQILPGKLHHVVCRREGKILTLTVDGKVVGEGEDSRPLTGPGHDMVGFYIYGMGWIDNVKVYTKGAGE